MKLTISSKELLLAVIRVAGAATDKKLGFYSLKAQNNHQGGGILIVSATDASLDIYSEHPCELEEPGEGHVLCEKFIETVRQLPNGTTALSSTDNLLTISLNSEEHFVKIRLPLISEYIWIPKQELPEMVSFQLPAAQLMYMISQVVFNLAPDPTLPYAELGYLHQVSPGVLRLVATDTMKLSYCDIHCDLPEQFLIQGICLSKKALNVLSKVCDQGYNQIRFGFCSSQKVCRLQVPGYDVFVRPSHVAYPYYTKLIPTDTDPPILLNKDVLISMIKRATISIDYTKIITFHFTHNTLTITSQDFEQSTGLEGKETLAIQYDRPELVFGINSETLLHILSHVLSAEVGLSIKHRRAPLVIFSSIEPGDCMARHVMAPIAESSAKSNAASVSSSEL